MKALEFKTKASRGIIKIPDELSLDGDYEVRVIVLIEDKNERKVTRSKKFKAIKIETSDFTFQRDEANAR